MRSNFNKLFFNANDQSLLEKSLFFMPDKILPPMAADSGLFVA
jgi:hypothetical protein